MKTLRTRFGLALCIVLLIATLLPILFLYILGASGLVEATYVTESQNARQLGESLMQLPNITPPVTPGLPQLPWEEVQGIDESRLIPLIDPETGQRFPNILFDPVTGQLTSQIPYNLQRVVFTSPVFKFRVDLPAWFVLGSLPLISLLIGISLSGLMSRSVTKPISQLAEAAKAIGRHDLSYRVETKGSQELHDLAESFNRMAEQLEHAETTRRNLTADVAHELRTPLAVLDGNLRAMLDGVHALNEAEIALLYEQTHHLNRLVDDLRELSLAESERLSLDLQPVDLSRLVRETVAHFEPIASEQGILLFVEPGEGLIHPALDDHRVRQALHNLLANALRHTPAGGTVKVTAGTMADENGFEITVKDTGAGISPDDLPHIFDRFYRAEHTPGNGTGLGLAIVNALTEAQGGHVLASSPGVGQGSTFTLSLPVT